MSRDPRWCRLPESSDHEDAHRSRRCHRAPVRAADPGGDGHRRLGAGRGQSRAGPQHRTRLPCKLATPQRTRTVKTRIAHDVGTACRAKRPNPAAGTAGWEKAQSHRARVRSALRAPSDWRAPQATPALEATVEPGADAARAPTPGDIVRSGGRPLDPAIRAAHDRQENFAMSNSAPLQNIVSQPLQAAGASLFLQRKGACGGGGFTGECEECANEIVGLQTKLRINEPDDAYEQEADRVAEQVLGKPAHSDVGSAQPRIQRYAGLSNGQIGAVPPSVDRALASPGWPLEPALRQDMEQRFGHDFSRVRVHSGAVAEQSAQQVDASAYTVGHDIVFGAGQFTPGTLEGRRLIAHELTHVVQQSQAAGSIMGERGDKHGVSPIGPSTTLLQRQPDVKRETGDKSGADNPYPEESEVIAHAVGAQKLGKLAEGTVLYVTKDWKATGMSNNAFYVGPFLSDMGNFYYVYRFTGADQNAGTYTLSRGAYLPASADENLLAGLAKTQGGKTLQVKTSGLSPPSGGASAKGSKPLPPTKSGGSGGSSQAKDPGSQAGSQEPSQGTDILPEFANKTVEECRETVGDIYGGLNKEANSGILDHKLDAVNGMQTILDKSDAAVSSNVIFFLSLVTNAAAGALGAGLPTMAANAIIWGAAGAANGAVALLNNDNLIDAVEFCQNYMQSLRISKDAAVKEARSAIVGDVVLARVAASAFRRMVQDTAEVSRIKLNQEREVVDLWTNTLLAEKERKRGRKVGGPHDPGKVGSGSYFSAARGRILLASGKLEARRPPEKNPFRWTASPTAAAMPGTPDRARQKNLNRKIGDVPVARTMRVATSANFYAFAVAISADGVQTAQPAHGGDPEAMHWMLASFLLDKPLDPATDDFERLIEPNWQLGITKCWDQVRNKTFAELGIKSVQGETELPDE